KALAVERSRGLGGRGRSLLITGFTLRNPANFTLFFPIERNPYVRSFAVRHLLCRVHRPGGGTQGFRSLARDQRRRAHDLHQARAAISNPGQTLEIQLWSQGASEDR